MSNEIHSILLRQLKRSNVELETLPENLKALMLAVNDAYRSADRDIQLLERSLELSAKEVFQQNEEIRATLESLPQIGKVSADTNKRYTFRELLMKYVEQLKSSKDSVSQQAELLRQQAVELAEARDEALESSKAKSAFLASMSHEIRTPMNAILGLLKIVLGTELENDQREYLRLAEQSGLSLLSLIEDILDLSKIEAGKLDIEHIEFKPRHTIKSSLVTLYHLAASKGVELLADIDHNLPGRLISDPNRLKQVLINLINNAIKFTTKGHVLLKVKCLSDPSDDECSILFSVKDTGIGIDLNKQSAIFNAFQQGDQSITRKFGGTGLGLNISQQLVNLLGGNIEVKSTLGEGSEFSFILDLPKAPESDTMVFTNPNTKYPKQLTLISENTPLVDIIQAHVNNFCKDKINFSHFHPDEILQNKATPAGLLLFDIGFGLNSKNKLVFKHLNNLKNTPIAIMPMTALSEKETVLRLGASSVLFKPFTDTDLLRTISHSTSKNPDKQTSKSDTSSLTRPQTPLKIVVVDDLHVNRLVAKKTLEHSGHEVTCFEGGRQLFDHIKQHKSFIWEKSGTSSDCDLILLDVQMPDLDGMETAQLIRNWESERNSEHSDRLTIVALTAHALKGDRERFIECGMDDYLRKPIDSDALSLLLNKLKKKQAESKTTVSPNSNPQEKKNEIIFDKDRMLLRFNNNREIVKEIISAYLEEGDELYYNLDLSLKSLDCKAIRQAAHSIKGSLMNVCGIQAENIAGDLEMAALMETGDYINLAEKLKESCEILKSKLMEELEVS